MQTFKVLEVIFTEISMSRLPVPFPHRENLTEHFFLLWQIIIIIIVIIIIIKSQLRTSLTFFFKFDRFSG